MNKPKSREVNNRETRGITIEEPWKTFNVIEFFPTMSLCTEKVFLRYNRVI